MAYEAPMVSDLGTLAEMTLGGVLGNFEDGAGKSTVVDANPIAELSLQVLP